MPSNTDFVIIILLIVANGIFVMSEMAIVSSRKARLQQLANQRDINAKIALELANSPNKFLAAIQIGITLLAIISGAFGESTISKILIPLLNSIPIFKSYSEAIATVIAILIITYLTLVIGELVPKRLALNNPEPIASAFALPMQMLTNFTLPVVYLLN
ncbi:MAG TPA: CNNM domain-containing protein, partial [Allocoleopsis sp.]